MKTSTPRAKARAPDFAKTSFCYSTDTAVTKTKIGIFVE